MTNGAGLSARLADASVVLCAGTGGVGKTTVAAAIGVHAAMAGRRAVVITVDPARRLADAMGIELSNEPQVVVGEWPGELSALMLDAKQTFDELVVREAGDDEQAEHILTNRLYQNISGVLSGTQEFMANEKLFELYGSGAFDVIVVDTPPTRNALDFLEAPEKLVRFLDGTLMRLMFPRQIRRAVNAGLRLMLRQVSSVVGSRIVDDGVAFLNAFQGMEDGFRQRAHDVNDLLASKKTAVVLVTSPRHDTVPETRWFADQVANRGLRVAGLVINRTYPSFSDRPIDELVELWDAHADDALASAFAVLVDGQSVVADEHEATAELGVVTSAPIVHVPLLDRDVRDLDSVAEVARYLGA
ncbi:MAG: AAA family ATPase [Acidimicrobiia bacterium]|nr:AAA family ATPase [Acidimicrobiia bacterium]